MKTKKTLGCYVFSNFIVSIFCFNFLITDNSFDTVKISNNQLNTLRKIYEVKVETQQESTSVTNDVYSVSVTKKDVSSKNISYVKPSYNSVTGKNVVNYAKHYLGLKYVHAGNSLTTGTDCSGFTKLIYKEFGISLGRTVSSQIYSGQYVKKSDLQPGDLVFYGYTNYASHVGIYMGDGLVIHQSNPRDGVKINSVNMMVYITARRVITENVVSDAKIPEDSKSEIPQNDTTKNEESNKEEVLDNTDSKKEDNTDVLLDETIKEPSNNEEEKEIEEDLKNSIDKTLEDEVVNSENSPSENQETKEDESNNISSDLIVDDSQNNDLSNQETPETKPLEEKNEIGEVLED